VGRDQRAPGAALGSRRKLAFGMAGLAAAGCAMALVVWMSGAARRADGGPLLLTGGRALPGSVQPVARDQALALQDGSFITVSAGGQLDLLESSGRVFSVALRHGRARFDVQPHGPRAWRIDCGAIAVEVVGTSFELERTAQAFRISVQRGVVLVRGEGVPDRVQRLTAGRELRVDLAAAAPRAQPALHDAGLPPPSAPEPQPQPAQQATHGDSEARWRVAARNRHWDAAFEQLRADGLQREARVAQQIEELTLLSDIARLSGHPREAVAPLQRIVNEHERDPRAALSAFALGRIRLDSLGEPAAAARDFERALVLGLPRALSEDAHARVVEALARANDGVAVRRAAQRYRAEFPQGKHRAAIDALSPPDQR
jgi:transmembrane sensor